MTRVLLISYHFPPQGGSGVQRASKFFTYLPKFNVEPIVLTGNDLMDSRWTPEDQSLLTAPHRSKYIHRLDWPAYRRGDPTETAERTTRLITKGIELVNRLNISSILVTMSPFQDATIARSISTATGRPWIADLRDPWALDEFQTYRTAWHRYKEKKRMRISLASASLIVMNTPQAAKLLTYSFPEIPKQRVKCITNGYDANDFSSIEKTTPTHIDPTKFNIVHTGTFHTALGLKRVRQKWINALLGRTHKGVETLPRSPHYLAEAISSLRKSHYEAISNFNIVFAGSKEKADSDCIHKFGLLDLVKFTNYIPHTESVRYLKSANLLFMPLHSIESGHSSIIPGKMYEYLASGNPILATIPQGDAHDILKKSGACYICEPTDVLAMKKYLLANYQRWKVKTPQEKRDIVYISRFERKALTKKLALIIESLS